MTREETMMALASITAIYPNFLRDRDADVTVRVWSTMFADEPYRAVQAALMAFFATDTKGFPPTPGQIKEKLAAITKPERTEVEAWALVSKAIRNGAYGYREEYAKLPEDVQAAVGKPEMLKAWALMDESNVQTVVASNFQRSYRAKAKALRDFGKLPESVRTALPGLVNIGTALPEGLPSETDT